MRNLHGGWRKLLAVMCILWAFFMVYMSLRVTFHPTAIIYGFIGMGLVICFICYPFRQSGARGHSPSVLDLFLIVLSIIVSVYPIVNIERFSTDFGRWTTLDAILGTILYILLVEGSRRMIGWMIPITALVVFAYAAFLGDLLPGMWWFGSIKFDKIMGGIFYVHPDGFAGRISNVMAMVVGLFMLLGPLIFATGPGNVFLELARNIGARIRGGAGQSAVICSAAFGIFSGSGLASVASVGSLTIPTMKQNGFTAEQAAAIECTASTGAQLTPPILGAAIFLMCDFLNVTYIEMIYVSIIPTLFFYLTVGSGVYFIACRNRIPKPALESVLSLRQIMTPYNISLVILPLAALMILLLMGFTPQYAASLALILTVLQYLVWGRISRSELKRKFKSLAEGTFSGVRGFASLMVFTGCMQTAVTLIEFTGLGATFSRLVWMAGSQNAFLALVLTAITAIILGIGLPTTAVYVIGVAVLAGGLQTLGFPQLPTHWFIFYYGMLAMTTPPVAEGIFAAIAIAKTKSVWRTAGIAMYLSIAAYVMPFMFMYDQSLLGYGDAGKIALTVISGSLGCLIMPAGLFRYFSKPATLLESVLFAAGGGFLMYPGLTSDIIGVILVLLAVASTRFMPSFALVGRRPPVREMNV